MLGTHTNFGSTAPVTFSYSTLAADVQPDTVSPHDEEALAELARHWDQVRLPNLIRGAARSVDLAKFHRSVVREAIREARAARRDGDESGYNRYVETARDALGKARQCHRFARHCERKAEAVILSGRYSTPEN